MREIDIIHSGTGRVFQLVSLFSVILGLLLASAGISAGAVPDPDRNATTPTGWHWWFHRTESQINDLRGNGERIIDLERSPTVPGTWDVVLVSNSGIYKRSDGWWYGYDRDGVVAKTKAKNGRITDLEVRTVNGQRRFDFALIRNEGDAAKFWWWNYDLTPAQVTADINLHKIRLIDLEAYQVNGQTRYAYVGIRNEGVDAAAWWWYPDATAQFVTDRINEFGARLIDIEVLPNGHLAVVMVKNNGTAWWWGHGASAAWVEQTVATTASRLIDLEHYTVNGSSQYAFISIDNANTETRRLRNLIYQCYDNPAFGDNVIRGFLVKRVGGATLADQAGSFRFQPLSTLKLLPYLHAMTEIDKGHASLSGSSVSWVEATVDDPDTEWDDRIMQSCLSLSEPNTQLASASFADALPTMMWESHGRTLDAFLNLYGPDNLTQYAHDLGLTQTEMHYGCPDGVSAAPWAANRSTLRDLARLFEGMDLMQFISKSSTRTAFFNNMINLNYTGASYMSPITGNTTGPLNVSFLRDIVKREAGPAKQDIVEQFLKHVVIRGKGGSGGPSSAEFGYSDFLHVTLPFVQNGKIVDKTYVVGWFIYKLETPAGCPEDSDNVYCKALWQSERDALATFRTEIHAAPIREALNTWPAPDSISLKIEDLTVRGSSRIIRWDAVPGRRYHLQAKSDLTAPWQNVGPIVTAQDFTATATDSADGDQKQCFYRVVEVPDRVIELPDPKPVKLSLPGT